MAKGVRLGRIRPCAFCQGRVKVKRRRRFRQGHAQRWRYGTKASRAGQLTLAAINQALKEHSLFYHHLCPHRSLDLLTPHAFLATLQSAT